MITELLTEREREREKQTIMKGEQEYDYGHLFLGKKVPKMYQIRH